MIAIIDYDAGNVKSVQNALKKLGCHAEITADHNTIYHAEKVIFPGVGAAQSAMAKLRERGLDDLIPALVQPVLGICLGMQLMCTTSEEGSAQGLGIFNCSVKRFPHTQIVPHMGWNSLSDLQGPLLNKLSEHDHFYFVHSYYAELNPCTTSVGKYSTLFSATMEKNNFFAAQFHPEKSSGAGLQLLENFLNI